MLSFSQYFINLFARDSSLPPHKVISFMGPIQYTSWKVDVRTSEQQISGQKRMDNPNTADRNVTPTCRYGHGDLSKVERTPESHFWGLIGANTRHFRTGTPVGQPLSQTELSGRIYTLQLFRCSICGYLEFFDDNIVNG